MIVLHGLGDSLEAYRNVRNELKVPNINYLVLNAPRKYGSGFTWCALNPRANSPSLLATRARLFALVEELKFYGWKTHEILWLGHSQGCFVASDIVLHHRESFAALVGVSGYVWLPRNWKSHLSPNALRTPWLMTHGTRDRVIPPSEVRVSIAKLAEASIPVEYHEFKKGHDFDFKSEVPFIRKWVRSSIGVSSRSRLHL